VANTLAIIMQQQAKMNWCWTAVAVSVADFFGNPDKLTQCELASLQLNQPGSGCCDDPDNCNRVSHLETSLTLVRHRRPGPNNPQRGIPLQTVIKQEIDSGRPIGVRIGWDDSLDQGHFVLVTGYDDTGSKFLVMINDPEAPDGSSWRTYSYDALQQGMYESSGSWTYSYFTA
jgi:hypothetical protein